VFISYLQKTLPKLKLVFILALLLGLLQPIISTQAQTNSNLFISEINIHGSIDDTNKCVSQSFQGQYKTQVSYCWKDEWLEIFNPTAKDIDLTGWTLELRNGKIIALSGILASGEYYTIGHTHNNGSFQSVISSFDISSWLLMYLSSDQAENVTYYLRSPSGEVVDSYNSSHLQIANSDRKGQSYYRCSTSDSWKASTQTIKPNNFGSPGYGNCKLLINQPQTIEAAPEVPAGNQSYLQNQVLELPVKQSQTQTLQTPQEVTTLKPQLATIKLKQANLQLQTNLQQSSLRGVSKIDLYKLNQKQIQTTQASLSKLKIAKSRSPIKQPASPQFITKVDLEMAYTGNNEFQRSLFSLLILTVFVMRFIYLLSSYLSNYLDQNYNSNYYVTRT
jgi:hypothetical protein